MKVKRLVANFATQDVARAQVFYADVLGLDLLMDHGWVRTYGSQAEMSVQVSFASEGGSGTPVPDLSIEVDDVDTALARMQSAGFAIEYGPVDFRNDTMHLWLPKSADWYSSLSGQRYHRRHTFSQFLLFSVDDQQKIGKPKEPVEPAPTL